VVNQVRVEEKLSVQARLALERMLAIPPQGGISPSR
jgi:quinolinate synthase